MSIFEEEPGRRTSANLLTRDEARPVAANIIRFVEAHDHVSVGLVVTYPTDDATALDRRAGEAIEGARQVRPWWIRFVAPNEGRDLPSRNAQLLAGVPVRI